MFFQTMQGVKVLDKDHERFGQAGAVIRQSMAKGKVSVLFDTDRTEVEFDHTEDNPSLQAL